jgi:acetyl esterase/lipase
MTSVRRLLLGSNVLLPVVALGQSVAPTDLLKEDVPAADHRIADGSGDLHFGELRLPKDGKGPHPVVMLVHGGCWSRQVGKMDPRATSLELLRPMAAALTNAGVATWNVEYRRLGDAGAGWPGSFEDLSRATDILRTLSPKYSLDLKRIVVAGHSSGGQLAMWIAARPKLAPSSAVYTKDALPVKAVMNLDGPADPAAIRALETKICGVPAVTQFLGGTPDEQPERYRDASALSFLPLGIPQEFIGGGLLRGAMEQILAYQASARAKGDVVTITTLDGAGHFDMLAPRSDYWQRVEARFHELLR